jgi:hypothetical protein
MGTDYLIAVDEFCTSHDIEVSFINSLEQNGLIEVTAIEDTWYIDAEQLQLLEKYMRFYYELNINLEGIDTINHLLQRVNDMHNEIIALKNRLRLYENRV